MPMTIDIATRTSPVVTRMALPRLPILHLPGMYSVTKNDPVSSISNKLHLCPMPYRLSEMAGTSTVTPEKDQLAPAQTTQTYPVQGRMMSSRKTRPRDEVGHYVCPNCGSPSLVRDAETGEVICTNCGFVLSDATEQYAAPVPRRTEEGLLESQSGPPGRLSVFEQELSTIISRAQASNRNLSADEGLEVWRPRRTELRDSGGSSMARNLSRAMGQLRG